MVGFEDVGSDSEILDCRELAEVKDLFDLFWEKPLEVHVLNIILRRITGQI